MNLEQKTARIKRAEQHIQAKRLVAGKYFGSGNKGCSVGCDALDLGIGAAGIHRLVAEHDGTAEWLERLRDTGFEGLPKTRRSHWHLHLARDLPITNDWEPVRHAVSIAILEYALTLAPHWGAHRQRTRAVIMPILDMHHRKISDPAAWHITECVAQSAAESAAERVFYGPLPAGPLPAAVCVWCVAQSAAESAAGNVAASALHVTESAAASAAGRTTSTAWCDIADRIINALEDLP